ncbi:hypothetical protein NMG60_11018557 [Bertholletia excelsa]
MANPVGLSHKTIKCTFCLLLLALTLRYASSARILSEVDSQPPVPADTVDDAPDLAPAVDSTTTQPSGEAPAAPVADIAPEVGPTTTLPDEPAPEAPLSAPATTSPPEADVPDTGAAPAADVAPPVVTPATSSPSGPAAAGAAVAPEHPPISFFMHDILGGTHPSGRVVTGIVANSDVNNLPFSKPNSQVFPINGGVPLNTVSGVINNNNAPLLVGLNGSPTIIQNNGDNNVVANNNNLPFVSAGQLPAGLTLQQLMFGSITVVDNELTEGHELGSAVVGKAQGFYLASSLDGTTHTLVLTALLHGGEHGVDDTISFFGIHRTGSPVSEIAVIGGSGKYDNASGYATIETLPQQDQHTTDGVETITNFKVYLSAQV